eukprot:TRINITY_DN171_c0_g1_i4.p1 TRINITY_DN171_c0_g1~~TRINITY_DN171_c0_g1_i4.p1  ORF type:complete len:192 (-),score=53.13 TRINITY_DN171_c0_g1_i4:43-618(-)
MTPCFRGIKRFIRNMVQRLRPECVTEASRQSTMCFMQYNDYKVRNELARLPGQDQDVLNVPIRSEQLDQAIASWDDIQKLGGTTRTIHAVESAQRAFHAAPCDNNKLIVLISDGVTDDWSDSITELLKIEAADEKAHLLVVGVAACSYYEDEFPTLDTLKLLGKEKENSLFMLSRDNESTRSHQLSSITPG